MTALIREASESATGNHEQVRTLSVAAIGTVLALVTYTTPIATLASTARHCIAGRGRPDVDSQFDEPRAGGRVAPAGAVGDHYGRRRMFGVGALGLGRDIGGRRALDHAGTLVLARIGEGLAMAAMLSCSLALIGHVFPPGRRRLQATGVWGASLGAGIATGPLLAGALDGGPGWRSAYWLIAALATVLGLVSRRLLTESKRDRPEPVDLLGMSLLAAALTSLVAGLVEGRMGWGRPLVAGMLSAVPCWARRSLRWNFRARPRCSICACTAGPTSPAQRSRRLPPAPP